ncbi:MAG TPA: carboxyltransferase domain-containing protein, partial [Acidothermaceae bacterium]|nr:carboxyltransferase domain-containing protein [Acidothermaceae bacterium]
MRAAVRPVGDAAFLLDVEPAQRHGVAEAIAAAGLTGVLDVVPAEHSVLVTFDQQRVDADVLAGLVVAAAAHREPLTAQPASTV